MSPAHPSDLSHASDPPSAHPWPRVRLGDVLTLARERVGSRDVPILSMTRRQGLILQSDKFDKRIASANTSGYKLVRRNQLVYGFPLDEGVIAVQHRFEVGAVSPIYNVWDVDESRVHPTFLDWFLRTPAMIDEYRRRMSVTVDRRRIVSPANFAEIEVPFPDLAEQRAIAGVLTTAQKAREASDKVIAATKELKKSLLRHLFTYGPVSIREIGNVNLKQTEVGEIPEHWCVPRIGDVSQVATGTTPSTDRPQYYEGVIPFVRTSDINNNRISRTTLHISQLAVRECRMRLFEPGTVLLAMYGQGKTRGQSSLLGVTAATTQNTAAMMPDSSINSEYLWHYLLSRYEWLRAQGHHGQISHLNLACVRELPLLCPPLLEQRSIAGLLNQLDEYLHAHEALCVSQTRVFTSLLHHLMTGQLRVPLNQPKIQNPKFRIQNEEPA